MTRINILETAEWFKDRLSLPVRVHDAGARHNLWMDCSKIKQQGICFCNTIDGLEKSIRDYNL